MAYKFDIFVSYRRRGNIPDWVGSVFIPELRRRLDDYLDESVRIALDDQFIDTGDTWPDKLSDAHARSKVFVVVLSANYFTSGWCMSEWRNAVDRQASLREANVDHPPLVFPLRYNDFSDEDIAKLPAPLRDEVRGLQIGLDFQNFTTLVNAQGDNERAMSFRDEVENLCESRLRHSITGAPPADDSWPRLPAKPFTHDDPRWRSTL